MQWVGTIYRRGWTPDSLCVMEARTELQCDVKEEEEERVVVSPVWRQQPSGGRQGGGCWRTVWRTAAQPPHSGANLTSN